MFVGAAQAGEYIADNQTVLGRAKNRGVVLELLRLPTQIIEISGRAPAPPPPPPLPQKIDKRTWRIVGKYSWKGKRRRIAMRGYFEFFAEPEVESTGSVNATDREFATFAAKWERGKGPGGELETKFDSWFKPDLKIERGKDGWVIALKKDIQALGGKIEVVPHLQLTSEMVKSEIKIAPFKIPLTLFVQRTELKVEPKINILIKVDLWRVLSDRVKNRFKDFVKDLLSDLVTSLGRGAVAAVAKKVLIALLGGALAEVFISDRPTAPVTAPPGDVYGKDRALALVRGSPSAAQILQAWADPLRREFAKAFADTLLELTREKWQDRLTGLRTRSLNGLKALPAPSAPDNEWLRWAATQKALQTVTVELPTDPFDRRFRWYELMLMFAVAAWILHRITRADAEQAMQVASEQARAAGTAAAVQYVNRRIAAETFDFIDEHGRVQKASGVTRWDTIAALIRSSRLSDAEIAMRLVQLGLKQLPGLVRVA